MKNVRANTCTQWNIIICTCIYWRAVPAKCIVHVLSHFSGPYSFSHMYKCTYIDIVNRFIWLNWLVITYLYASAQKLDSIHALVSVQIKFQCSVAQSIHLIVNTHTLTFVFHFTIELRKIEAPIENVQFAVINRAHISRDT